MKKQYQKIIYLFFSVVLIGGSFFIGKEIGEQKIENKVTQYNEKNFSTFWEVWDILNKKHPDGINITDEEKIQGAISGLVSSLKDPYTTFFPPKETKEFTETISGEFSGVGMEVGEKNNSLTVISPIKNTPAYNAGIQAGDIIVKIDNKETLGLAIDEAISYIRGEKGTTVVLTIQRGEEHTFREFALIRDTIQIPTLETELTEDNIFVIKFYSFSLHSPELFRDALQEFSKAKTNKLILDLRNNPGGYLDAAINITSWFLDSGTPIVIEDFGDEKKQKIYRSRGNNLFNDKLDFIILVNEGSASASEIMAGALQEHGIAKLVGKKTFGKGSVQELIPLNDGTSIKVTVAKWLTPNGISISEQGLTPDHEITNEIKDEILIDKQFLFAKKLLLEKE